MADVASAMEAIRTNTEQIAETKSKLQDVHEALGSELALQADLQGQGTVAGPKGERTTPEGIKQEMQAELEAQNANQKRAQSIDYENASLDLLGTIIKTGKEKQKHLDRMQEIAGSSFIDQIIADFTDPHVKEQAAIAGEQQDAAAGTLAKVNQAMQQSAKTTAEVQTKITGTVIDKMQQSLAIDASLKASQLKIESLKTGAAMVAEISNLNAKELQNSLKQYEIGMNAEQMALQRKQFELSQEHLKRQLEKDAKEGRMEEAGFKLINLGLAGNGKTPFPETQKELIQAQMKASGPVGDQLRSLMFQGQTIGTSGGQVVQGSTPAEAAEFRANINYTPTTSSEQKVLEIVNGVAGSPAVQEAKSKAAQILAYNEGVAKKLDQDQSNISTDENSLAPPATWANLATSKAIIENNVWRDVIAPTITDNISTNPAAPADMYKRLVAGISAGKTNINEASNFFKLYAEYSRQLNNANSGLEKLTGLKQTKFIAKLPQPSTGFVSFLAKGTDKVINAHLNPVTQLAGITNPSGVADFVPLSSKTVNGLDPVAIANAMALSVAGAIKRKGTE